MLAVAKVYVPVVLKPVLNVMTFPAVPSVVNEIRSTYPARGTEDVLIVLAVLLVQAIRRVFPSVAVKVRLIVPLNVTVL